MRKPDWFAGLIAAACFALGSIWVAAQSPSLQAPPGTYTASVTLSAPGQVNLPTPYSGPAGEYKFTATVPVVISKTDTSYTISWSVAPVPPPGPPVPPTPPPPGPPAPTNLPLYVAAVYEYDDLAKLPQPQVDLRTSVTIASALRSLNATWRDFDKDSKDFTAWSPDAVKAGIPSLVVISVDAGKGTLVEAIPLPADEFAVIAEVKKLRKAK